MVSRVSLYWPWLTRRCLWIPVLLLATLLAGDYSANSTPAPSTVVIAVGDTSCSPSDPNYNGGAGTGVACTMKATSDLALALSPDVVLALGDNQYETGSLEAFQTAYAPTWGRLLALTHPVPGNHEYNTADAAGYFSYFGPLAGDPGKGYYSFDLPGWHLVALNSNCSAVGGCEQGSAQESWLRADLASHQGVCTLAFWHHPRFSSGGHGDDPTLASFWNALYDYGADVVLNGHDHDFERFHRLKPDGFTDAKTGIREFVVGTGGKNSVPFATVHAGSAVRIPGIHGVLRLALRAGAYDWAFHTIPDGLSNDSGSTLCHRAKVPARYFTVPPCRIVDTRGPEGPLGAPPLAGGVTRSFILTSTCGIPAGAAAVAANLTVVGPTMSGDLRIYPAGEMPEGASSINFKTDQTRANNAVLRLGADAAISVLAAGPQRTTVQFIIDVNGYFLP